MCIRFLYITRPSGPFTIPSILHDVHCRATERPEEAPVDGGGNDQRLRGQLQVEAVGQASGQATWWREEGRAHEQVNLLNPIDSRMLY